MQPQFIVGKKDNVLITEKVMNKLLRQNHNIQAKFINLQQRLLIIQTELLLPESSK